MSLFAEALVSLFDYTGFFARPEWARFLGVTEADIEEWLADRAIPIPSLLRMTLDALTSSDGVPSWPVDKFRAMAALPAREVSPLGYLMGVSVRMYLTWTLADESGAGLLQHAGYFRGSLTS